MNLLADLRSLVLSFGPAHAGMVVACIIAALFLNLAFMDLNRKLYR